MEPEDTSVVPKKSEKSAMNIQEGATISIDTFKTATPNKRSLTPVSRSLTPKDQVIKKRELEKKRVKN